MKKAIPLLIAALAAISPPLLAARITVAPANHAPIPVYEAYRGSSNQTDCFDMGYAGVGWDAITVVPGVLAIDPGPAWSNYIKAAQEGVPYAVKNVVLRKQTPTPIQCADVFPSRLVQQQGTPNIRLTWPLMYEVAGTTWTLTILYGTTQPYDDDGTGPNPAGYVHTEIWQWQAEVTLDSLKSVLVLLHQLPFGTSQTPLISDEILYETLQSQLEEVAAAKVIANDLVAAGLALGQFEMILMDGCLAVPPSRPNSTGPGTGVAQTAENPACCKLLTDAEFLGFNLGIYQPKK